MMMLTCSWKTKRYQGPTRNLKRTFLSQIAPLVLMLFVGSCLTLAAGKMIDQSRDKSVSPSALEQKLGNRF